MSSFILKGFPLVLFYFLAINANFTTKHKYFHWSLRKSVGRKVSSLLRTFRIRVDIDRIRIRLTKNRIWPSRGIKTAPVLTLMKKQDPKRTWKKLVRSMGICYIFLLNIVLMVKKKRSKLLVLKLCYFFLISRNSRNCFLLSFKWSPRSLVQFSEYTQFMKTRLVKFCSIFTK